MILNVYYIYYIIQYTFEYLENWYMYIYVYINLCSRYLDKMENKLGKLPFFSRKQPRDLCLGWFFLRIHRGEGPKKMFLKFLGTLSPIIMVQWKMGSLQYVCIYIIIYNIYIYIYIYLFLSCRVIFHFHDYGRKGTQQWKRLQVTLDERKLILEIHSFSTEPWLWEEG